MRTMIAAAAALLITSAAGSAFAAPPADQDACNSLAFSLAEKAADKKPADPAKVDALIVKLESQCGEGKLAEAGATADEIEAALK